MASMPSFDPNSFSDGIGRVEWQMLAEDDHVPLRNKVLKGLYPPGSTVKPMVAMAFLEAGLDPDETISCGGGLRRRQPRVPLLEPRRPRLGQHGQGHLPVSCDIYFYHFAQRIGMDAIAPMAKRLGHGAGIPAAGRQPVASARCPTRPGSCSKYDQPNGGRSTRVNATIGQGYMLPTRCSWR